jgi:hypothetical protein
VDIKPLWAIFTVLLLAPVAVPASAQPVISAKSGMVAKIQGSVFLDDQALADSATHFPDVKEKQVVRTEDGLAEILLTPSVFLRVRPEPNPPIAGPVAKRLLTAR